MSQGVFAWSKTVASNATADAAINLRDNQAPSNVKTNNRTFMAEISKWRDDINGSLTTSGSGTAYTISSNQDISAEGSTPDGFEIAAVIHAASGVAPTLSVDSQDAAPITYKPGFAPDSGMLELGSIQRFRWVAADTEWRLMSVVSRDSTKTGAEQNYWGSSLPTGFVWANGQTIGNASSNATGRANADTSALFSTLWTALANTEAPILDSAGSTTTRGVSAAADFAANKALTLPNRCDRVAVGMGTMGGVSAAGLIVNTAPVAIDTSVLGKHGGADRDTLDATKIPSHSHTATDSGHTHPTPTNTAVENGTGGVTPTGGTAPGSGTNTGSGTANITVANTGGGLAHNNVQPTIVCNVIIKL